VFAQSASVSAAIVMNQSMWNPAWINLGLSNIDSATHEYCRGVFSCRSVDEPSPGSYPPVAPGPKDWARIWDVLGDSADSGPEEAPVELRLKAAQEGEDGAPPALGEFCVPLGFRGFRDFCVVSSVLGVGGLVTFEDSPATGALLVEESRLIS
jgi:hypothetical protein